MANQNPRDGGGRSVPLDLPTQHVAILRENLAFCLEGVRGDLETPETMLNPGQARRDAQAYERLLAGLERGWIVVPDESAREAVTAIATAADRENEYVAVVAQHDAFEGLLAKLAVTEGGRE